ncbi:hypothetical protein PSN45_004523 [Yamadazyma tenuis]|uniref:uncharacterized protein n=1 Tax=Candida tenuis TaxID=2315449 RepID=UPI0027A3D3DF|nr:hypothetical protein PSN45_004523 [Yamadazyma tenuis]
MAQANATLTYLPMDLISRIQGRFPTGPLSGFDPDASKSYDPIWKSLLKFQPPTTSNIESKDNTLPIPAYSQYLTELLNAMVNGIESQRPMFESSIFTLTTSIPTLKQNEYFNSKRYPDNYLSKILIDNFEQIQSCILTYSNLNVSSHLTKFLVNLIYSLQFWEVYHLINYLPNFKSFLVLLDFDIVETYETLIRPPKNYLEKNLYQGFQYPFPYPFYNFSYHTLKDNVEQKYADVHITPYIDIRLRKNPPNRRYKKKTQRLKQQGYTASKYDEKIKQEPAKISETIQIGNQKSSYAANEINESVTQQPEFNRMAPSTEDMQSSPFTATPALNFPYSQQHNFGYQLRPLQPPPVQMNYGQPGVFGVSQGMYLPPVAKAQGLYPYMPFAPMKPNDQIQSQPSSQIPSPLQQEVQPIQPQVPLMATSSAQTKPQISPMQPQSHRETQLQNQPERQQLDHSLDQSEIKSAVPNAQPVPCAPPQSQPEVPIVSPVQTQTTTLPQTSQVVDSGAGDKREVVHTETYDSSSVSHDPPSGHKSPKQAPALRWRQNYVAPQEHVRPEVQEDVHKPLPQGALEDVFQNGSTNVTLKSGSGRNDAGVFQGKFSEIEQSSSATLKQENDIYGSADASGDYDSSDISSDEEPYEKAIRNPDRPIVKYKPRATQVIHQCHLLDPTSYTPCLKIFYGKNELLRHQEFVHATRKKIYKCLYCSRNGSKIQSYPRHDSLARHIRRKHGVTGKENKLAVNYAKENVEIIEDPNRTSQGELLEITTRPLPHPQFLNEDFTLKPNYAGFLSFNTRERLNKKDPKDTESSDYGNEGAVSDSRASTSPDEGNLAANSGTENHTAPPTGKYTYPGGTVPYSYMASQFPYSQQQIPITNQMGSSQQFNPSGGYLNLPQMHKPPVQNSVPNS